MVAELIVGIEAINNRKLNFRPLRLNNANVSSFSETSDIGEEAEVLLDAILGALSSKETMDRFVSALVGYTRNKSKTNRAPCSFP